MLKNYLKIVWRNITRNKVFSFINIAGLAIGLSCFILIASYVAGELSCDRYNEKADRIYRVDSDILLFIAAGAVALLIALLTVSFQAIKAAIANPVKSLRTE